MNRQIAESANALYSTNNWRQAFRFGITDIIDSRIESAWCWMVVQRNIASGRVPEFVRDFNPAYDLRSRTLEFFPS